MELRTGLAGEESAEGAVGQVKVSHFSIPTKGNLLHPHD